MAAIQSECSRLPSQTWPANKRVCVCVGGGNRYTRRGAAGRNLFAHERSPHRMATQYRYTHGQSAVGVQSNADTCSSQVWMKRHGPRIVSSSVRRGMRSLNSATRSDIFLPTTRKCPPAATNTCGRQSTFSASCVAAIFSASSAAPPHRISIKMSAATSLVKGRTSLTRASLKSRARVVTSTTPSPCAERQARKWQNTAPITRIALSAEQRPRLLL